MPIRFNECRRGFAPKCTLKFNKQITANVYDHQTITKLDILVDNLLKERDVLKYVWF